MENMVKFIVFPLDKRIPHSDHLLLCNSDTYLHEKRVPGLNETKQPRGDEEA
jgi:hypothetical protein